MFYVAAARGRPLTRPELGHTAELRYEGQTYKLDVRKAGTGYALAASSAGVVIAASCTNEQCDWFDQRTKRRDYPDEAGARVAEAAR